MFRRWKTHTRERAAAIARAQPPVGSAASDPNSSSNSNSGRDPSRPATQARSGDDAKSFGGVTGGGAMISLQQGLAAHWSPRTYRAFACEGMMQNAVVFRCVRLIAEAAASVPLRVIAGQLDREETGSASGQPALGELLAQPQPGMTATDLFEAWYGYLLVSGNAYLKVVVANGRPCGLHVLRPDRMQVVTDRDGWVAGYAYTVGSQTMRYLDEALPGVAQVLHMKLFHPHDDHYGLSPIEAAATAIDIHNGASRWNKALLDNAARPSGALVYNATDHMTGEQFARLKGELEQNFQGSRNAGRPLLLEGGLDWKAMSLTPRDMDFIAAKDAAAREIALALGVPPMLLGIPGDNTYANYQEANRTFWRQTVLPLVKRTTRALATWLQSAYAEPASIEIDLDNVEALSAEREALWRRVEGASFLSDDEKREALGFPSRDAPRSPSSEAAL